MLISAASAHAQSGDAPAAGMSRGGSSYGVIPRRGSSISAITPACTNPHVSYFGGPVISDVQIVPVLWSSSVNSQVTSNIATFYGDAAVSTWFDVLNEYSTPGQWIGHGGSAAAITLVPSLCTSASSCSMTDAQLQSELAAQIQSGVLPAPRQDGAGNTLTAYMVHFPPNVTLHLPNGDGTSCIDFCAYHSTATYGSNAIALPYAAVMDEFNGGCSTGCGTTASALQNTTEVASRELVDIVTDTDIGLNTQSAFAFPAAWAQNSLCGEVGDICNVGNAGTTITVDGRLWFVQQMWSNNVGQCVMNESVQAAPNFLVIPPANASLGGALAFTVTARLATNTTYTGYAGTVHFTSTDANAVLPPDFTYVPNDQGNAGFTAAFANAGAQTITATDTLNGTILGTSAPINVDGTSLTTLCATTFVENQSVALTATVHSGSTPTGNVSFAAGATPFCNNVGLASGSAGCATGALALQGINTSITYGVVASYGGDASNSAATSAPLVLTVLKASDVVFRGGFEPNLTGCPTH